MEPTLAGPPMSALGVALIRARESARADALYEDPVAAAFVAAARAEFVQLDGETRRWDRVTALADRFYPGRTAAVRVVDDHLVARLAEGVTQVVLIGAGLDTRALRLGGDAVHWFEVDLPGLFAFKERVLGTSPDHRHVVPADLTGDWLPLLVDAGFRSGVPTAWVEEGVGPAWTRGSIEAITRLSAPESSWWRLAMATDPTTPEYSELRAVVGGRVELRTRDATSGLLTEAGWRIRAERWDDLVSALGRPEACTGNPDDAALVAGR